MRAYLPYYFTALAVGCALAWLSVTHDRQQVDEFFGFAETEETEINFNYPIEIGAIRVQPGALVRWGDTLMLVRRARAKETLPDQDFRIEGLAAEQRLDLERLTTKLGALEAEEVAERLELRGKLAEVTAEADYRSSLLEGLGGGLRADGPGSTDGPGGTGEKDPATSTRYSPLDREAESLRARLDALDAHYARRREALTTERELAAAPYSAESRRLAAERDFDVAQAEQTFAILAPTDGVVGSVNVKLGEHKPSFAPLINFYEPNPSMIKAFIHEDRLLQAQLGDSMSVRSLGNPNVHHRGAIVGLGSRIVEIPARLRRMPDLKTYGREVVIAVPSNNDLIQREKVVLTFTQPRDEG